MGGGSRYAIACECGSGHISGGIYGQGRPPLRISDWISRCFYHHGETCGFTNQHGYESVAGVRQYGENPSTIPGFKTVSMRDVIMHPGSKTDAPPTANPMICHILEGELRLDQDGRVFTGKKNFVFGI